MRRRNTPPIFFLIPFLCSLAIAHASRAYDDGDYDYDDWLIEGSTQEALENAKTNETTFWQNPDSGSSGAITPIQTYQNSNGQYCREYQKTVTIGGREERAYGTACRMPDGQWQTVRDEAPAPPEPTVIYRERVVVQPVYRPVPRRYYDPWWPTLRATAAVVPLALHIGLDHHRWHGHARAAYRVGPRGVYYRGSRFRRGHHRR